MVLFGIVVTYALCTTFRTIFKFMTLIYKQMVYAKLFKSYSIIMIFFQFFKLFL